MGCCLTDRNKGLKDGDGPIPTDSGIGDTEEENKEFMQHGGKLGKDLKVYQTTDYDEDLGIEHLDSKIDDDGGESDGSEYKRKPILKMPSKEMKKANSQGNLEGNMAESIIKHGFRNRQGSITDLPAEIKEMTNKPGEEGPENSQFNFILGNGKGKILTHYNYAL